MLDKSVPYYNILMCRPGNLDVPHYDLPEGFRFSLYEEGNEKDWAEIEWSVGEYPRRVDALAKFQSKYFYPNELKRRCVFIENSKSEKIATATIWWEYSGVRRDPWVSYVAVKPEYQGQGLSKCLISRILEMSEEIEGKRDVYLHTQTWSHVAVRLYKKFGFYITREPNLYKYPNDEWEQAEALLEEIYRGYPKDR